MRYYAATTITRMTGNNIFVFGSNPEGRHGAGAAKAAMAFGAMYGIGRGRVSNTYALVTKNLRMNYFEFKSGITYNESGHKSVTLEQIRANIVELYEDARANPELKYFVTYQKGAKQLNGYTPQQMFDAFTVDIDVPDNMRFHNSWR